MNYKTCAPRDARASFPLVFDQLLENFVQPVQAFRPLTNVAESEQQFMIEMAVSGIAKEAITIALLEDKLVVGYVHPQAEQAKDWRYSQKEFLVKSFERRFKLPQHVNREAIQATVELGVLRIFIPKQKEEQTELKRNISIEWK